MAEPLRVVEEGGEIGHGHDEQGRNVHRHHLAQDHTAQLKLYHHSPGCIKSLIISRDAKGRFVLAFPEDFPKNMNIIINQT